MITKKTSSACSCKATAHHILKMCHNLQSPPTIPIVTALNRGTSIYLTNLLGMFDILTQQEIAKVKPYICQSNCLNITINHC